MTTRTQAPSRVAIAIEADVADPTAVEAAVERAADEVGQVEILVNNAGFARRGRIVNVSSISALNDPERRRAGQLRRRQGRPQRPHEARRHDLSLAEHAARQAEKVLVGRIGQPKDVARAVALFTDEDADFITGQIVYVSGCPHG